MKKGIDVSSHQGEINWRAAAGKIFFAVIRSSFGESHVDKQFEHNVSGCAENRLPYGLYHYSYAETPEEAVSEAKFFVKTAAKAAPALPLFLDFEEPSQRALPIGAQVKIIKAFLGEISAAGYKTGLYGSKSFLEELKKAAPEIFDEHFIWCAQWNRACNFSGRFDLWQSSCRGSVPGVCGFVDIDILSTEAELALRVAILEEKLLGISRAAG